MKVKELIERLQKFNSEKEVLVLDCDESYGYAYNVVKKRIENKVVVVIEFE